MSISISDDPLVDYVNSNLYVHGLLGGSETDQFIGLLLAQAEDEAVAEVLDGSTEIKSKKSRIYEKEGGSTQADEDFDQVVKDLGVSEKSHGSGVRSAELPDGTSISVRRHSSDGRPTIQINRPSGKPIKIRYK
jgi:hypothetical protein